MSEQIQPIALALQNEEKERDFYLEHSRRTTNPVGKKMFEMIAEDEDIHFKRLTDIHTSLIEKGVWPRTLSDIPGTPDLKKTLDNLPEKARRSPETDMDDIRAIETAIAFEARGHQFYTNLADSAADEQQRNFFTTLARMEFEHLNSLKDTLLLFTDPQTWFQEHEKPHYDA